MVTHPSDCDCNQCGEFGGIKELAKMYSVSDFTELKVRKIYAWLKAKNDCHITKLDFEEPTAPKLSDIVDYSTESMVFEPIMQEEKTEGFTNRTVSPLQKKQIGIKYLLLKDILLCS